MKRITLIIFLIICLSSKAQSIIKPLSNNTSCPPYDTNCYEKDVDNVLEKFTGEWKYQDGNTTLILKLKKELNYQISSDSNYIDMLVGEYEYIEDGIIKVNSLADFDNVAISGYDHNISGSIFIHTLPSYCNIDNSNPSEIKIELMITDPNDELKTGRIILRHISTNNIDKLEVCIYDYSVLANNSNDRIPIPDGFYVFTEQD